MLAKLQQWFKRRFNREDDTHEFKPVLAEIETDPGSPLGGTIFWVVIAVFAVAVLWTFIGQVDVVVTARGKTIPAGEVKTIQPLNGGVISEILVKEGDFVKRGQALVLIDPATTEPELRSMEETLSFTELERQRLSASSDFRTPDYMTNQDSTTDADILDTQQKLFSSSQNGLQQQIQSRQQEVVSLSARVQATKAELTSERENLTRFKDRQKRLENVKDIVAKSTYDDALNTSSTTQSRVQSLSHEIERLHAEQRRVQSDIGYLRKEYQTNALQQLSETEKQANQLRASIDESRFRNAQQTLRAPVAGYIHELFIHTEGGVVSPAEKVMTIVPKDVPLVVLADVLNKDIGFVKAGMPVELKIDTFSFQKYGALKGEVVQVDIDSHDDEMLGPVYSVYVKPLDNKLLVEGKWETITSGLSVTTEVKTGKRRIIEFFIYPLIKYLDEGMSVR